MHFILTVVGLASVALGQQTAWGKCGGVGWDGPTTCVSGYCCTFNNEWYSQCLPGSCTGSSVAPTSSKTTTTTVRSSTTTTKSSTTTTRSSTTTAVSTVKLSTSSRGSSTTTTIRTSSSTTTTRTSSAAVSTFTNPLIYQDIPDNDVFLGPDGYFYLSASNFHFSPGAPILRSKDLQNWENVGHSVPTLDFGDNYSLLANTQAYRKGTWASSMRYRKSNKTWYWVGCIDFWNSFIYTASSPSGPWVRSASLWARCFYDCGLFIDDDDTMYVVHGSNNVNVTQLSATGLSEVQTQQVLTSPPGTDSIEGNRMYKRNGVYYILNDVPSAQATYIWKSSTPYGPWVSKLLQQYSGGPLAGGGTPHQGSLVETPLGDWYFISFTWAYPLGRIPVIAPITWGTDGYPILGLEVGKWAQTYPNPLPQVPTPSWTGTDSFTGTTLGPRWEWNHNPDTTKFVVNNGVTLTAVTVTDDLYRARNTLTHRLQGGTPVATIILDTTNLADGDRCGLAAFRDWTAYIGVVRSGTTYSVVMHQNMTLSTADWTTTNLGTTVATASVPKGKIWLRGLADARSAGTKLVTFQYSLDGITYTPLGGGYTLQSDWAIFIGYRWGIFNFATKALGGSVKLLQFNQV